MASLPTCAPSSHSIGTLRRPSAGIRTLSLAFITPTRQIFLSHLNLRSKMEAVKKKRLSPVSASNANPLDGSDSAKTGNATPGPPLLTILAGAFVFLFVCWIIGSMATWFVGLIIHPPSLK